MLASHQFKADLTARALGAITACREDLWHIQEKVKGAYCCKIISLSETDRTSKKRKKNTGEQGTCQRAMTDTQNRLCQCISNKSISYDRSRSQTISCLTGSWLPCRQSYKSVLKATQSDLFHTTLIFSHKQHSDKFTPAVSL